MQTEHSVYDSRSPVEKYFNSIMLSPPWTQTILIAGVLLVLTMQWKENRAKSDVIEAKLDKLLSIVARRIGQTRAPIVDKKFTDIAETLEEPATRARYLPCPCHNF